MQNEYQTYGGTSPYGGGGSEDLVALGILAVFGFGLFLVAVIAYVVNAIFLSKILKNAGHSSPVAAAWVPVWNTAALMDVGGIKKPWAWTAIIIGGSFLSGLIPGVGFLLSLAVLVVSVIVTIWLAKGLQGALRTGGTGGIVLAVLLPVVWVIWMGIVSGRERYDRNAALRQGDTMPMNWFGDGDRNASFPGSAPQGSWETPSTAYPQGDSYGGNRGPATAPQGSWTEPRAADQDGSAFSLPSLVSNQEPAANPANEPDEDLPKPPSFPRYAPPVPQDNETEAKKDEDRPS